MTKIRTVAKKNKEHSTSSKKVLETVKEHYKEFDKSSEDYVKFINENCNDEFWKVYIDVAKDDCDEWLKKDEVKVIQLFKNITIGEITKLLRDNFLCHHYLSVFYIFKNEMTDEYASNILKILQTFDEKFELDNDNYKKVIERLNTMKTEKVKTESNFEGMEDLKDTTIGKIAKEIIDSTNIDKIK